MLKNGMNFIENRKKLKKNKNKSRPQTLPPFYHDVVKKKVRFNKKKKKTCSRQRKNDKEISINFTFNHVL